VHKIRIRYFLSVYGIFPLKTAVSGECGDQIQECYQNNNPPDPAPGAAIGQCAAAWAAAVITGILTAAVVVPCAPVVAVVFTAVIAYLFIHN